MIRIISIHRSIRSWGKRGVSNEITSLIRHPLSERCDLSVRKSQLSKERCQLENQGTKKKIQICLSWSDPRLSLSFRFQEISPARSWSSSFV